MKKSIAAAALLASPILIAGCGNSDPAASPSTVTVTESASPAPGAPSDSGSAGSGASTAPGPPKGSQLTNANPDDFRSDGYQGDVAFVSPSGNVWCRLGAGQYSAGCQAEKAPIPAGADCRGNDMNPVDSLTRGFYLDGEKVTPSCFNQGVFASPERKPLPYGYTITANGYTCTSREDGMTCNTPSGEHGFVLSMQEARSW
ncbi:MAG: hypothetical protein QM774_03760 [Gordonia sp. (in: high G+C Gram-positive bacteria)]|uniref:DUF6636 domain-containing protein n=1 Tax=Gordonia sp. (in: high G+C Gram-positive bacteria) TaxID=84139 RepID=UPI0039E43C27